MRFASKTSTKYNVPRDRGDYIETGNVCRLFETAIGTTVRGRRSAAAAATATASRYKWAELVGVPAANGRTRPRLACVVVAFPRHPTARKPQLNRGARDTPHRGGAPLPPPTTPSPPTTPPPPATTTTTTLCPPNTILLYEEARGTQSGAAPVSPGRRSIFYILPRWAVTLYFHIIRYTAVYSKLRTWVYYRYHHNNNNNYNIFNARIPTYGRAFVIIKHNIPIRVNM